MTDDFSPELRRYEFLQYAVETQFRNLIDKSESSYGLGEEINKLIMDDAFFATEKNYNKYRLVADTYWKLYNIDNDKATMNGLEISHEVAWNKVVYSILNGKFDLESMTKCYDYWKSHYEKKTVNKANVQDWEYFVFMSWASNNSYDFVEQIKTSYPRKLLSAFVSLDEETSDKNINEYKIAFNKNRNNILFHGRAGVLAIYFFYHKTGQQIDAFKMREAQLIGIR